MARPVCQPGARQQLRSGVAAAPARGSSSAGCFPSPPHRRPPPGCHRRQRTASERLPGGWAEWAGRCWHPPATAAAPMRPRLPPSHPRQTTRTPAPRRWSRRRRRRRRGPAPPSGAPASGLPSPSAPASATPPAPPRRGRWVSIFLDRNTGYTGKSQSKRPPKRTQRPPHLQGAQLLLGVRQPLLCLAELAVAQPHRPLQRRRLPPAQAFPPSVFLDKNRRDIGKTQSTWSRIVDRNAWRTPPRRARAQPAPAPTPHAPGPQ
jgi:hypothetical protein